MQTKKKVIRKSPIIRREEKREDLQGIYFGRSEVPHVTKVVVKTGGGMGIAPVSTTLSASLAIRANISKSSIAITKAKREEELLGTHLHLHVIRVRPASRAP